jgi:hypothetical protein
MLSDDLHSKSMSSKHSKSNSGKDIRFACGNAFEYQARPSLQSGTWIITAAIVSGFKMLSRFPNLEIQSQQDECVMLWPKLSPAQRQC